MTATRVSVSELRRSIAGLHEAAGAVDLREYEPASGPDLEGLLGSTRALLERAVAVLDAVLERYDRAAAASASEVHAEAHGTARHAPRAVADLAAVARMALRGRLAVLDDPPASRWGAIATASSALRAAQKSLGAVDLAIADCEGLEEAAGFFRTELARSLLVRREYARFRRDLLALPAPSAESVHARLRSAGNLIARLVGSDAYAHIRIKDRALLRDLQGRLQAHLVSIARGRAAPVVEGLRLWQDVEILARLFDGVNRREELVRNDEQCARDGIEALAAESGPASTRVLAQLAPLVGRDEELDRMLRARACSTEELRAKLLAVAAALAEGAARRRAFAAPPPPPPAPTDDDYL